MEIHPSLRSGLVGRVTTYMHHAPITNDVMAIALIVRVLFTSGLSEQSNLTWLGTSLRSIRALDPQRLFRTLCPSVRHHDFVSLIVIKQCEAIQIRQILCCVLSQLRIEIMLLIIGRL